MDTVCWAGRCVVLNGCGRGLRGPLGKAQERRGRWGVELGLWWLRRAGLQGPDCRCSVKRIGACLAVPT